VDQHYLSAKDALEKLGTDQVPLWMDGLLGAFLGAFMPGATLPQAIALTLAVVETLAPPPPRRS
jgi:hypothetical protein